MAHAILFVCLLSITSTFASPSSRILEGEDAVAAQFPWIVSVRLDNAHCAVGNIITQRHILTSGSCISQMGTIPYDAQRINVRVGSFNQYAGGRVVSVASAIIHPSYGNFLHDLAILTLAEPLEWTDKIKSIDLAEENLEVDNNTEITVSGWGLQASGSSPYKLQHTKMHPLALDECELRAGYGYESTLCLDHAEKQGICRGDNGAGAVANSTLVGVLSFAFGSCGSKYPDIASRVSFYRQWIDEATK